LSSLTEPKQTVIALPPVPMIKISIMSNGVLSGVA
jgi:hypothetical protein